MAKLTGVETSRGVAAVLVLMVHVSSMMGSARYFGAESLGGLIHFGHAGVDFFFVLSGFIIQFVHGGDIGRPDRLAHYAWRRFVRIYPTYWVICLLIVPLYVLSPTPGGYERDAGVILGSAALLPLPKGPVLGPAWTLQHEALFYLIFALVIVRPRLGIGVMAAWGLGILVNMAVPFAEDYRLRFVFRLFNIGFFFGIFVAEAVRRWGCRRPRLLLALGLGVFFGAGMIENFSPGLPHEWPPLHLAYSLGAALILYGLVGVERTRGLRIPAPLIELGTASYSIYLTHVITIMAMQQVYLRADPRLGLPSWVWFWLIVAAALAVGLVVSRLIEQPLLRRARRVSFRRAPRGRPTSEPGLP
jgi:peptidoglycan/LPS O-acetylase OafA/YrhL